MIDIFPALFLGLIFLISIRLIQGQKRRINEPPMVPYKFPIIGHSVEWWRDAERFLNSAREKYGEIFTIYVFGRVLTITGKGLCYEFMASPEMSFLDNFLERVPLFGILGESRQDASEIMINLARTLMTRLDQFRSHIQKTLQHGVDELIGNCDEPKIIPKPIDAFQEIVARTTAHVYLGEESSHDKEVVKTFKTFTADAIAAVKTRMVPDLIHPWLGFQWILLKLKFSDNPVHKHRQVVMNYIKPIIEKRLEERKCLGDKWQAPNDLIQDLIDHPLNSKEKPDLQWMTTHILVLVWVAIHTTSTHATSVLQEYGGRPEYWQELLDEQLEVAGEDINLEITVKQLNRMVKLDSFIKESLRSFGHVATLFHKTMVPVFTFSNGYQIPKGRSVGVHETTINRCNGPADEFDGRRFVGKDSPATRIGRDFVVFGLGKHACPGRYLAITEIKILISKIIRRYKVTTETGKPPIKECVFGMVRLSNEALIFENRKK